MSNDKRKINVIGVPLDLGANIRGANIGPAAIRNANLKIKIENLGHKVTDYGDIHVPIRETLPPAAEEEKYLSQITTICQDLSVVVEQSLEKGQLPITIGGDHSLAIGSISGASHFLKKQNKKLGVIWIDAHADINNPRTSTSGNIHGMPVATLLNEGPESLNEISYKGAKFQPDHIVLIGIRSVDQKEKEALRASNINFFTMRQIDELGIHEVMKRSLKMVSSADAIHLSVDIDGIDPSHAPGVSTPVTGGLSYRETHFCMEALAETDRVISMDFVELNPIFDTEGKTANLTIELIQSALGKSIV